ncbi:LLM class flavin-dependent oxidoreductase [Jiangella endophytica]|uniref:LLM class flavin-dependent oxidoreductase n=1 Tax=Jiangella endophytica TaxID=1623398 RepID=UPI000E3459AD|nr:LLM class flavin-dependent oxidoreductase [Jiangella endophytica]
MAGLRIGFAVNIRTTARGAVGVHRVYEDVLDTIVHAERAGLDSAWIGQHHFDNTDGPFPSPLVFLAAAAQRTDRIVLGTGITTLPFEDPLRLAEDAAVLDALAPGRIQLGLGTGGANLDGFRAFGLEPERRHAIFAEKVQRLHHVLDGAPLDDRGDGPRLFPSGDGIRAALWQAATSVDGARAAARAGDGLQQGAFFDPADAGQRPKVEAYLDEWVAAGRAGSPRVAIFRFVYSGSSKEAVVDEVEPVLGSRLTLLAERAARSGNESLRGLTVRDYLDLVPFYGSSDDIAERVRADPAIAAGATDFVANFSHAGEFDADDVRARIDVLAGRIGPAIGWRPAREVRDAVG